MAFRERVEGDTRGRAVGKDFSPAPSGSDRMHKLVLIKAAWVTAVATGVTLWFVLIPGRSGAG